MITFEQAEKSVLEYLGEDFKLYEIIDTPYAWIFCYGSKDPNEMLAGNSPIFVSKKTGTHSGFSSSYRLEKMVEMYEEGNDIYSLQLTENEELDNRKILFLKNKLRLSYQKLLQIKKGIEKSIVSGSQNRLFILCNELLKENIQTQVVFSWD